MSEGFLEYLLGRDVNGYKYDANAFPDDFFGYKPAESYECFTDGLGRKRAEFFDLPATWQCIRFIESADHENVQVYVAKDSSVSDALEEWSYIGKITIWSEGTPTWKTPILIYLPKDQTVINYPKELRYVEGPVFNNRRASGTYQSIRQPDLSRTVIFEQDTDDIAVYGVVDGDVIWDWDTY